MGVLGEEKHVDSHIHVIKDMYKGVRIRVRIVEGNSDDFPIDISLHQGSALSPFLCTLVLDDLTQGIQDEVHGALYLVMIIFLINETMERANDKLEQWGDTFKVRGFRLSRYRLSEGNSGLGDKVTIGHVAIPRVEKFRYLGSII